MVIGLNELNKLHGMKNGVKRMLTVGLRIYQVLVSPVLGALAAPMGLGCRYQPTCSQYALEAVQKHGSIRGVVLALGRVCRCHPWGGSGFDPVPPVGLIESGRGLPHSKTFGIPHVSANAKRLGVRQSSAAFDPPLASISEFGNS